MENYMNYFETNNGKGVLIKKYEYQTHYITEYYFFSEKEKYEKKGKEWQPYYVCTTYPKCNQIEIHNSKGYLLRRTY